MRDTISGQGQHGSVPNVRPPEIPNRPTWNSGQVLQQAQGAGQYRDTQTTQISIVRRPMVALLGAPQSPMGGGGGSFLGTAAAAAAGAVGGSLLMNSIRSMMGGSGSHHSLADQAGLGGKPATQNPWSDQSGSGMARDAGINDIGSSAHRADDSSRSGLLDTSSKDDAHGVDHDDMDLDSDDFGGDGDSDYA